MNNISRRLIFLPVCGGGGQNSKTDDRQIHKYMHAFMNGGQGPIIPE